MRPRPQAATPEGLVYRSGFLSVREEQELLRELRTLPLQAVEMRGQVARRRTAHFGWLYGYSSWQIEPGQPLPAFLADVRTHAARLAGRPAGDFEETLITHYPPGAGIGWHRDAPMFGPEVIGLSLGAPARLRFQRGKGDERQVYEQLLEPRSAYVLAGEARRTWQHSIPAAKAERWSITLRTLESLVAARDGADRPASRAPSGSAG